TRPHRHRADARIRRGARPWIRQISARTGSRRASDRAGPRSPHVEPRAGPRLRARRARAGHRRHRNRGRAHAAHLLRRQHLAGGRPLHDHRLAQPSRVQRFQGGHRQEHHGGTRGAGAQEARARAARAAEAEKVRAEGADLGVAFDGDSDRLGAVDEKGQILWGDQLLLLFARDVLEDHPGATIVSEVKCSQTLYDDIEKRGGRAIMWKAGHSLIKAKMKEEGALLAGEMSGHLFFRHRYYGFDDGIYSAARLLELVARKDVPFSQLLGDVPRTFSSPEIRKDFPDDKKFAAVEKAKEKLRKHGRTIEVDGVRVIVPGG